MGLGWTLASVCNKFFVLNLDNSAPVVRPIFRYGAAFLARDVAPELMGFPYATRSSLKRSKLWEGHVSMRDGRVALSVTVTFTMRYDGRIRRLAGGITAADL